jgi:hypothetical protein
MASNFRDCILDRIHTVAKRIVDLTDKTNPHRSPSTVQATVVEQLPELINELELLTPLLKRIAKDPNDHL